jgi:hypothetical protein
MPRIARRKRGSGPRAGLKSLHGWLKKTRVLSKAGKFLHEGATPFLNKSLSTSQSMMVHSGIEHALNHLKKKGYGIRRVGGRVGGSPYRVNSSRGGAVRRAGRRCGSGVAKSSRRKR